MIDMCTTTSKHQMDIISFTSCPCSRRSTSLAGTSPLSPCSLGSCGSAPPLCARSSISLWKCSCCASPSPPCSPGCSPRSWRSSLWLTTAIASLLRFCWRLLRCVLFDWKFRLCWALRIPSSAQLSASAGFLTFAGTLAFWSVRSSNPSHAPSATFRWCRDRRLSFFLPCCPRF